MNIKYYYFIDEFNKNEIEKLPARISLIYRNYHKKRNPKELRRLVDKGKKEIGEGLIIIFTSKDEKVGLAVGVTTKLTSKYDAVKFAKLGSEIIGGKGGGGRPDFAQAGGLSENKIDEAFEKLKVLI